MQKITQFITAGLAMGFAACLFFIGLGVMCVLLVGLLIAGLFVKPQTKKQWQKRWTAKWQARQFAAKTKRAKADATVIEGQYTVVNQR